MLKLICAQMAPKDTPVLVAALLMVCAGSLAGCGASLDNETAPYSLAAKEPQASARLTATPALEAGSVRARATPASDKFTSAAPGSTAYKIGPQDVLDVSVFKVAELSKTVQVADTGTVNLPLVGEIPAAGKTAQEVERDLTAKLGAKYLQKPQVTVYVKEYNSQHVTIEGAVKKPGVFPMRGRTSLLQLVATAEGLDANADSTVVVFREVDGKRSAARFELNDIRSGQAEDPVIQSGDLIVVSNSTIKETFNIILKALPVAGLFVALM
jgi:polysaccharide export outer membrane protein